jgi:hypothetical protein
MTIDEKEIMVDLAKQTDASSAEFVYNESIRHLVKILARKAAEEGYTEFLAIARSQYGEDIDSEA